VKTKGTVQPVELWAHHFIKKEGREMEHAGKKRWRGGIIYLREDGTIEKVVGGNGKTINPEKEKETAEKGTPQPVILMRGDPEERCIYSASGNCYCT
jgi:hypothetical protein